MKHLTKEDFNVILESLRYTKVKFEEYSGYPSSDFKARRIEEVIQIINKVRLELEEWDG